MPAQRIHCVAVAVVSLVLACSAAGRAQAPVPGPGPGGPPQAAPPAPEFPPIGQVTAGHEARRGFLHLYVDAKKQRLLGELPGNLLGKPFLLAVSIASGELAGWQWDDKMVYWERHDRRLVLIEPEIRYRAQGGTLADVVKRTYRDRILVAVPILAEGPGGSLVIDLMDLFAARSFIFAGSLARGIDPTLTKIVKAKAFPKNVEIELDLARVGGGGGGPMLGLGGLGGGSGGSLGIHYSISELPSTGYRPRVADDRIGYFLTAYKDFAKDPRDETRFVRHVNRWHLEKADPSLELSPPREPIVFYVEKTVPIRYRRYVHEGILEWNKAFEKVGILGAVAVRQQTDTEFNDLDPEDVRYNFFRWITSENPFAMGPSRVHPETGEILDADIIFDDSMIRQWLDEYAQLIQKGPSQTLHPALQRYLEENPGRHPMRRWLPRNEVAPREPAPGASPAHDLIDETVDQTVASGAPAPAALERARRRVCDFGEGIRHQVNLGLMALAARTDLAADGPRPPGAPAPKKEQWPEELIGQVLKEVVMHEVGHTLGLRHNFKASSWLALGEINSAEKPPEAITGSVMDYNPTNISPEGKPQGVWNTRTLGPYDYWAIEYGYTLKEEPAELGRIAGRVAENGLAYATDEDTWSSDPLVNRFDMSSDPLEYARSRMEIARQLLRDLVPRAVKAGQGYQRARQAFDMLIYTYASAAWLADRHVGGHYTHRDHKGDPNERPPVEPVPAAKQREALRLVCDSMFSESAFRFEPALLKYLAAGRWEHWGSRDALDDPEYPLYDRILQLQLWTLFDFINPRTLTLIADAEARVPAEADAITIPELLDTLTSTIWSELDKPRPARGETSNRKPFFSTMRRNLQHEHVGQLIDLALEGEAGAAPHSAKTQAWRHLKQLRAKLDSFPADVLDDYSRAHLEETSQRIARALEATFSRDGRSGGGGGFSLFGRPAQD